MISSCVKNLYEKVNHQIYVKCSKSLILMMPSIYKLSTLKSINCLNSCHVYL